MAITPTEALGLIGCKLRIAAQQGGGCRTMPYTGTVTELGSTLHENYLVMAHDDGEYRIPLSVIVHYTIADDPRWDTAGTIKDGEVTMVDMEKKLGLDDVTFDEYEGCDVVITMKNGLSYTGRLERHRSPRMFTIKDSGGTAMAYREYVDSIQPARDYQSFPEGHTLEADENDPEWATSLAKAAKDAVDARTGGDHMSPSQRKTTFLERVETEVTDLLVAAGVTQGIAYRLVEDMLERITEDGLWDRI